MQDKKSFRLRNGRLFSLLIRENDLFAAWKRIVSDWARNAPLLHLNYRDTRTVMIQNAHGIATNDIFPYHEIFGKKHQANGAIVIPQRRQASSGGVCTNY